MKFRHNLPSGQIALPAPEGYAEPVVVTDPDRLERKPSAQYLPEDSKVLDVVAALPLDDEENRSVTTTVVNVSEGKRIVIDGIPYWDQTMDGEKIDTAWCMQIYRNEKGFLVADIVGSEPDVPIDGSESGERTESGTKVGVGTPLETQKVDSGNVTQLARLRYKYPVAVEGLYTGYYSEIGIVVTTPHDLGDEVHIEFHGGGVDHDKENPLPEPICVREIADNTLR
jgi:hypothetical protein